MSHYSYENVNLYIVITLFMLEKYPLCQHYARYSDYGIMPKIMQAT